MADDETTETENEQEPEATEPEAVEAEEPVAEEPVAEEPVAEPVEKLHPKEVRKRSRSRHEGDAGPARTVEERKAQRDATRAAKAVARRRRRQQEHEKAKAKRDSAGPATEQPQHEHGPGRPKVRQGVVVSDKADKTITVRIDVARRHRRYQKVVRSSSTVHAHDERNDAHEGDTVRVIESRPLSRTKRWRLVEVLERAR
jgi:small subunit ribosomal protein S17